jgi:Uma2 family endonuclease
MRTADYADSGITDPRNPVRSETLEPLVPPEELRARIGAACAAGQASIFVSGVDPGFINDVIPLLLSGLCERVDEIRAFELFNYSTYAQPDAVRNLVGMGQPMDAMPPMLTPGVPTMVWVRGYLFRPAPPPTPKRRQAAALQRRLSRRRLATASGGWMQRLHRSAAPAACDDVIPTSARGCYLARMAQLARLPRQGRYSAGDLWRMPDDDQRYEIIEGEVVVSPAPYVSHQQVLANLNDVIRTHVQRHGLGTVLFAPIGVVLETASAVQPDLIFVAKARRAIVQAKGIFGAPDLVVEILSPSTAARDRGRKRELYARAGVAHYWYLDPRAGRLTALRLAGARYAVEAQVGPRGSFRPALFPGLTIRVRDLLER